MSVAALKLMLVLMLAVAAGTILWRTCTTGRVPAFLCLFLILPLGQLFLLRSFSFGSWSPYWLWGLALSLGAHILLLVHTILRERRAMAEEALRDMQHQLELEQSHYNAVERRRHELEALRVDFGNRLEAVAALIRQGEEGNASEGISQLARCIDGTREKPYCAIPVVNAILAEKEQACAHAHITLWMDLMLPPSVAVEPMHLCSIFSNLLDNAIAECRDFTGGQAPVIRLSSKVDGDYLFIKVTNPSGRPQKPLPGRGYGTRILADLADRYGGVYKSAYQSGEFAAIISILV